MTHSDFPFIPTPDRRDFPGKPIIVWFRRDLRIEDNAALSEAASSGRPVIPVFIWASEKKGKEGPGAANRWWLHYSLLSLKKELTEIGLRLILRRGAFLSSLLKVASESEADLILWNRDYEPSAFSRDKTLKEELLKHNIESRSYKGMLLFEPGTILNKEKKPFKVFTPFWQSCVRSMHPEVPLPKPEKILIETPVLESEPIEDLKLLPKIAWDGGLKEAWIPGAPGALSRLDYFLKNVAKGYKETRDYPFLIGTSRLSPHLHHGEITPRMIRKAVVDRSIPYEDVECFFRELGWREFAYHLLAHYPEMIRSPLNPKFEFFRRVGNSGDLSLWKKGMTGYPIVDAGMRELWHTGWMHNRVRMIVGSFLVKDLAIDWQEGAGWFLDTLVDADLANNTMGWQWVAGCGADAAPFFRIFNPVLQGEKFDPSGQYVRRWIPEIRLLHDRWIHRPWEAPHEVLASAGIVLDKDYPNPIVDHAEARKRALKDFSEIKGK